MRYFSLLLKWFLCVCLPLLYVQVSAQTWIRKGNTIDAIADGDGFGRTVDIAADGNTIVVGARSNADSGENSGQVSVFKWVGGKWEPKGKTINGDEANGYFGSSVAISSKGDIIAVGAKRNSTNGLVSGQVRIYFWKNGKWEQMGNALNGGPKDYFGHAISLSSEGARVAVGAHQSHVSFQPEGKGYVHVYEWNGSTWKQLGATIEGEGLKDESGESLNLSSDGNTLAIGSVRNDGGGKESGHIRVFSWKDNAWVQKGKDIDGESTEDYSGRSVDLDEAGNTLIIGATWNDGQGVWLGAGNVNSYNCGHARVYSWNGSAWVQKGKDLDGDKPKDEFGRSVSISGDGNIIAIGASYLSENIYLRRDSGYVKMFNWDGEKWVQIGDRIPGEFGGEFGSAVSLNKYGNTLIAGAKSRGQKRNGGYVQIYTTCLRFSVQKEIVCDSFMWTNGKTYYSSTHSPLDTLSSIQGCDSFVRLDLKVLRSTTATDRQTACDSFTWMNGQTYYNSNDTAQYIITNDLGCDSIITLDLKLIRTPYVQLPQDTIICYGTEIGVDVNTNADQTLWSTGEQSRSILARKGNYKVRVSTGQCYAEDSLTVSYFDPLKVLLRDHFYICEKEKELVKLDAGKGFINYLWTPTGDTTQWIIVDKVGDYYVIVDDYRGCSADKGTHVSQRCDIIYHVPNAFSPNGDGINDIFNVVGESIVSIDMQIYNRWGELIHVGDEQGWDGGNAPPGVFVYMIQVHGFLNKKHITYNLAGNATLIK